MDTENDTAGLARRLEAFLATELGEPDLRVEGLRRLGGGSSRENWAFDLVAPDGHRGPRPMLLRRDPVAGVADTDRALEVGLLRALFPSPVPAPVVIAADLAGAGLARPAVVLERAPGRADRAVLRDRDPFGLGAGGRARLAGDLCDLLAHVHGLDALSGGLSEVLGQPPADPARREIERWEQAVVGAAGDEPQPELAYAALWLREHRPPPPERCTLVHGDYRPANVLVDNGGVGTLLDWEFAHLGDPAEDLGWYCTPVYRREHFLEGAWSQKDFMARYEVRTGTAVDPDRLHFWSAHAMFKLGAIALAGVASFLAGTTDRAAGPIDGLLRSVVAATRRA